jgi:hypothetical protein
MRTLNDIAGNPFALMLDPQSVLDAMDRSERLARLQRHICHPLDKPLLNRQVDPGQAAFDELVDDGFALDS